MIHIVKASKNHVQGISNVCTKAYWATYGETHSKEYIAKIIRDFYNMERITNEVTYTSRQWGGYFAAVEHGEVIGAGGGGMIGDTTGEIFVMYVNPARRNEGIGSMLLEAITKQQKEEFSAAGQWVSVQKGNTKGIPFYEAKGFTFKHEQNGYGNSENESYISLRYYRKI